MLKTSHRPSSVESSLRALTDAGTTSTFRYARTMLFFSASSITAAVRPWTSSLSRSGPYSVSMSSLTTCATSAASMSRS